MAWVVRVVVGQSHRKASEVNSDQTLPVYIAKHDTLDTPKVIVGFNLALWVLVRGLPRGLPSREIRHDVTTRPREAPNLKFLRIAPKPPSDLQSQWGCWYVH